MCCEIKTFDDYSFQHKVWMTNVIFIFNIVFLSLRSKRRLLAIGFAVFLHVSASGHIPIFLPVSASGRFPFSYLLHVSALWIWKKKVQCNKKKGWEILFLPLLFWSKFCAISQLNILHPEFLRINILIKKSLLLVLIKN